MQFSPKKKMPKPHSWKQKRSGKANDLEREESFTSGPLMLDWGTCQFVALFRKKKPITWLNF